MKEGKTKSTAKKKTTNRTSNTRNTKNVKEVKAEVVEEKFFEEDDDDKRLIVFIAIAILIIVGTIIGLLVGCQKEKEKEPEKQEGEDIVIPVEPDKKDDKEKEYNREKPLPVVRKVTKKSKKTTSNNNTSTEEKETYTVIFHLNEETNEESVEKGAEATHYVPDGYSSCNYYTDSELTNEYEFGTVSGNTDVYMSCSLIQYTIVYSHESSNPSSYNVEDGEITLVDATSDSGVFEGWFTSEEDGEQVTVLNKSIVSYADSNNTIYLYGRFTQNDVVVPTTGASNDDSLDNEEEPADGNSIAGRTFMIQSDTQEELEEESKEETSLEEDEMIEEKVEVEEPKEESTLPVEEVQPVIDEEKPVVEDKEQDVEEKEEVTKPQEEEKLVSTEPSTTVVETPAKEETTNEKVVEVKEEKQVVQQKEEKKEEVKEEPEATPVNEE